MVPLDHPDLLDMAMPADAVASPCAQASPVERSAYGAPPGTRPRAFAIMLLLHIVVLAAVVLRWSGSFPSAPPSAPLVVTLLPLASPPEVAKPEKPRPTPERDEDRPPVPARTEPIDRTTTPLATPFELPPPVEPARSEPIPKQAETAAPDNVVAPPAPRVSSNAADSWEGRVLARLEKFRRYPPAARGARQQGVVYIRFRIDRAGRVLTSSLVRSSGYPALDQAALDTLARADPLPRIPADRPAEIELAVPVEFYIR